MKQNISYRNEGHCKACYGHCQTEVLEHFTSITFANAKCCDDETRKAQLTKGFCGGFKKGYFFVESSCFRINFRNVFSIIPGCPAFPDVISNVLSENSCGIFCIRL